MQGSGWPVGYEARRPRFVNMLFGNRRNRFRSLGAKLATERGLIKGGQWPALQGCGAKSLLQAKNEPKKEKEVTGQIEEQAGD